MEKSVFLLATIAPIALAQLPSFAPAPGQPMHRGDPGTFEIIPDTLISSQQVDFNLVVIFCIITPSKIIRRDLSWAARKGVHPRQGPE